MNELLDEGVDEAEFASAGKRYIKGKGMMHTNLARVGSW